MLNDLKTFTGDIPKTSSTSCTEYFYEGCQSKCCPSQCRPCCINSMINDHTYSLLKRICRKIIKDYNRQQCREKYTLFDGGNSVNVRIHRSSSSKLAAESKAKMGISSSSVLRSEKSYKYKTDTVLAIGRYVDVRDRKKLGGSSRSASKGRGTKDYDVETAKSAKEKKQKYDDDASDRLAKTGKGKKIKDDKKRRYDDDDDDDETATRKGQSGKTGKGKKKGHGKKRRGDDEDDDDDEIAKRKRDSSKTRKGKKLGRDKKKRGGDDEDDDDDDDDEIAKRKRDSSKTRKGKKLGRDKKKRGDDDEDDDDDEIAKRKRDSSKTRKGKKLGRDKKTRSDDDEDDDDDYEKKSRKRDSSKTRKGKKMGHDKKKRSDDEDEVDQRTSDAELVNKRAKRKAKRSSEDDVATKKGDRRKLGKGIREEDEFENNNATDKGKQGRKQGSQITGKIKRKNSQGFEAGTKTKMKGKGKEAQSDKIEIDVLPVVSDLRSKVRKGQDVLPTRKERRSSMERESASRGSVTRGSAKKDSGTGRRARRDSGTRVRDGGAPGTKTYSGRGVSSRRDSSSKGVLDRQTMLRDKSSSNRRISKHSKERYNDLERSPQRPGLKKHVRPFKKRSGRFRSRRYMRHSRCDEIKPCDILRAYMEERELCEMSRCRLTPRPYSESCCLPCNYEQSCVC